MKLLILALASLLVAHAAFAADQHLTLRLEDGIPKGKGTAPITLAVPITNGNGGPGVATAPFYEYGPHTIDAGTLRLDGERLTGTVTGKFRKGAAMPVWTLDATIKDGRVIGTATAPAAGQAAAVQTRVSGWLDAPTGGAWIVEAGMPWSDLGSHAKLAADNSDFSNAFIVRLRFTAGGGQVLHCGRLDPSAEDNALTQEVSGGPEAFTAKMTFPAKDGKTPIAVTLKGGRIGRGGQCTASITCDAAPRVKEWTGPATVWAWPDAPGFVGGAEQTLPLWKHDAEPDPALVAAAVREAATPIHPIEPGKGEVWQDMVMHRGSPRCIAPPVFDIRPLPVAAKYRLTVTRIVGKPLTLVDEDVTDPFAALTAVWDKPGLGKFRVQFLVDGKPATAIDLWLREAGELWGTYRPRPAACPSWLTPVMQGDRYRVRVHKAKDKAAPMEFTVKEPWAPLTEAWTKLAPGEYRLEIQGIGADGKELGPRPWSTGFEKVPSFQGPYFKGPAQPYHEAILRFTRWTSDRTNTGNCRGHCAFTGAGGDFCNGHRMHGALAMGLLRHRLGTSPEEREAGLMMAIEAGDFFRGICLARGGMPHAYKGGIPNTQLYGIYFLDLYAATRDVRWRDAALMVAKAYARLQLANGTWAEVSDNGLTSCGDPSTLKADNPLLQAYFDAGVVRGIHGPHPLEYDCSEVLWFLGRLRQDLNTTDYRETEERAYRWVMDQSVATFYWRDQGQHSPCMVPPMLYTGRAASYFALYLLDYAPAERRDLKLVAELMRYCEDRHLDWSRPDPNQVRSVFPNLTLANARESGSPLWLASRFALVWLRLGQTTGDPLALAKARALMDTITHAQHPVTGNIDIGFARNMAFNIYASNTGRAGWNLLRCADLLAPDSKTKGNP
jgi:hypothetical protein